jgi:hypothetical protein
MHTIWQPCLPRKMQNGFVTAQHQHKFESQLITETDRSTLNYTYEAEEIQMKWLHT